MAKNNRLVPGRIGLWCWYNFLCEYGFWTWVRLPSTPLHAGSHRWKVKRFPTNWMSDKSQGEWKVSKDKYRKSHDNLKPINWVRLKTCDGDMDDMTISVVRLHTPELKTVIRWAGTSRLEQTEIKESYGKWKNKSKLYHRDEIRYRLPVSLHMALLGSQQEKKFTLLVLTGPSQCRRFDSVISHSRWYIKADLTAVTGHCSYWRAKYCALCSSNGTL